MPRRTDVHVYKRQAKVAQTFRDRRPHEFLHLVKDIGSSCMPWEPWSSA